MGEYGLTVGRVWRVTVECDCWESIVFLFGVLLGDGECDFWESMECDCWESIVL